MELFAKKTTLANRKILLIDDDHEHNSFLKRILKKLDLAIHIVSTLKKAEKFNYLEYDMIVIDIAMENKNGLQMLKYFKMIEITQKIPVIVVSKLGDLDYIDRVLNMGAADFIVKTENHMEKLVNLINKHLVHFTGRRSGRIA